MQQDTQLSLLYIVKILRFCLILVALYLAKTMYVNKYNDVVYVQRKHPPSLLLLVGYFLLIDLVMNMVLWTILFYVSWLEIQKNSDFFLLNNVFFSRMVVDYVVSTALIGSIGCLLCILVQSQWKLDGVNGFQVVSAFKQMLLTISGFALVPQYFLLVG